MAKKIYIKLTKAGPSAGPFKIFTDKGKVLAESVSKKKLIQGFVAEIENSTKSVTLQSVGKCSIQKTFSIESFTIIDYAEAEYKESRTGCIWRHLTDTGKYNSFYGVTEPYIIEYPFAFQYQDEILQNVKDYTKAFVYKPSYDGTFNQNTRVEVDNMWFNKAILYNGQQSSGILELVQKPKNNLQSYGQFPKYKQDSKVITYTKSDNFYQYNTFWSINKTPYEPLFLTSCESLSLDKLVNQDNMDYGHRSFKKAPLRAKELKIRHILDNSSQVHLVSQFIIAPSQISYK